MHKNIYNNIVVIGGNASGLAAASQARRINPDMDITVLESGKYISYGTCGLPYYISGYVKRVEDLLSYPKDFFEEKRKIKILTGHRVVGIGSARKELLVNIAGTSEHKIINYDKLIISSGASTIVPDIPGINSSNVFQLRNVEDALKLKDYIDKNNPKKAVIIGGGQIGMLMAEAFNKLGMNTSLIEMKKRILGGFEYEISTILSRKAEMENITVLTDTAVSSINNSSISIENEEGKKNIDCDLILLATGISANTGFLSDTSIELGKNNAIKVDNKLQTSHMNIYACGDC
ncbi:MAG TPA: dehydrogenase, partial [Actinobacteria bacterium]|nr:dehydrogenase [Actinomycetota bacterium]